MQTGKQTTEGFLPSEPSLQSMFEKIGLGGGWSDMGKTAAAEEVFDQQRQTSEDLKRCYVQIADTPAGKRVLEDLLDQTLRRACSNPDPKATLEQEAMYSRERKGQNGIMVYILKMIHDGRNLPTPKKSSKKK